MKRPILTAITLSLALGFSACVKQNQPRQKPAPGPKLTPFDTKYDPDSGPTERKVEEKRRLETEETTPVHHEKVPPPPKPQNPEYAVKVEGKPGYVKSPYDGQGRLIDVRGLPPGTEAECPYTRRTFLVPP